MIAPSTVDDLGVDAALYLLALLLAQDRRRAVAPTRRLALSAMETLRDQGVIDVPWPLARWEADPAAETTPFEGLQWRYRWPAYHRELAAQALADFLEEIPRHEEAIALRIRLWKTLVAAEAQRFFDAQLERSLLPREWASDLQFVLDAQMDALSLAQWRYCVWAAVRQGAAMSAERRHSEATIRERVFAEIQRRASAIASGRWVMQGFDSRAGEAVSALSLAFLRHLAPIGAAYDQQAPSAAPWNRRRSADEVS